MSGIIVIVLVLGVIALLRAKMGDASYEKMVLMLFGVLTLAFSLSSQWMLQRLANR